MVFIPYYEGSFYHGNFLPSFFSFTVILEHYNIGHVRGQTMYGVGFDSYEIIQSVPGKIMLKPLYSGHLEKSQDRLYSANKYK